MRPVRASGSIDGMGTAARYDVVVVGTGSGGKIAAIELARQGRQVLAVERHRFGGECPYVACVPSKALLLAAQAGLTWDEAVERRDVVVDGRDDSGSVRSLTDEGVVVRRGHVRLAGRVGDRLLVRIEPTQGGDPESVEAPVVVLGTGSRPKRPPVDGLDAVPTWTSDEALSTGEQPERLVVLGGGAVGCELAQAYARLGTTVSVVETAPTLLAGEAAWVGGVVARALRDDGVDVRTGVSASRAEALDGGRRLRLTLDDGAAIEADRLLLAGGRTPNSADLDLATVGARVDDTGAVTVDLRCRVVGRSGAPVPGLYAVGDLTAESSYTHSANHQARVAAAEIVGRGRDANYSAVPRAVYVDPPVLCVGVTVEQAGQRGLDVVSARFDVDDLERATLEAGVAPHHYPHGVPGGLELVADARTGVLVGASCAGPQADSWGAELALAVRARLDVRLLAEHMHAFLSWPEGVPVVARELAEKIGR